MEEKSKTGNPCKSGIKTWPVDDRPREKLLRNGEHSLSNSELLAILLRTGVKGESAVDLSRKVLSKFKSFRNMSHTDIRDWSEFKGLGHAKIAQIKAAIEIGRRFCEDETRVLALVVLLVILAIFAPHLIPYVILAPAGA